MLEMLATPLAFLGLALLTGQFAYRAWFRPEELRELERKVLELDEISPKLLFPKRRRARFEDKDAWIEGRRILSTFVTLVLLTFSVITLFNSGVF